MPSHALLNNIAHKDLKIITTRSAAYGDQVAGSLIFPEEFTQVQREYPIFFQKDSETGEFQAIALFGFKQDENLFLKGDDWSANYIPALMRREPFLIGFQSNKTAAEPTPMIYVNMSHPRISKSNEGQPVFLPMGGNTPYIDDIAKTLLLIHEGVAMSKDLFEAFLALELLESFTLNIEFNNGEKYASNAYYTLNQDAFFALDSENLEKLHRCGYLHYAYMVIASLGNIQSLINKRNALI
jgi:SapC